MMSSRKFSVLVVAPDEYQVRIEIVQRLAHGTEAFGHARTVAARGGDAGVVAEFGEEFGGPVGAIFSLGWDVGRGQQVMEAAGQPFVGQRQPGIMRAAQSDDLCHLRAPVLSGVTRSSVAATVGVVAEVRNIGLRRDGFRIA